jgi:hypothetical protein
MWTFIFAAGQQLKRSLYTRSLRRHDKYSDRMDSPHGGSNSLCPVNHSREFGVLTFERMKGHQALLGLQKCLVLALASRSAEFVRESVAFLTEVRAQVSERRRKSRGKGQVNASVDRCFALFSRGLLSYFRLNML